MKGDKMFRSLMLVVGLSLVFSSAFAEESQWDKALEKPPAISERNMLLAEAEAEFIAKNPDAVRKPILKSEYEKERSEPDSAPSLEVTFSQKRGRNSADSYGATSAYVEIPLGGDGLSLWVTAYKDPAFTGTYIGLAKKFDVCQIGLGSGNVHYGEVRHTVVNPWLYCNSEKWEGYVHLEHYSRETESPWWHKGYIERKFDNLGVGLYREQGMGLGPRVSFKLNDHAKIWITKPMWSQPETGRMKLFFNVVFSF